MERSHDWLNLPMFTPVKDMSGTISFHFFMTFEDFKATWQHKVSLVFFDKNNAVKMKEN